jgi:hypothetical protein
MFEIYIRTLLNLPNTIIEFTSELKPFKNALYAYAQRYEFEDELVRPHQLSDECFNHI